MGRPAKTRALFVSTIIAYSFSFLPTAIAGEGDQWPSFRGPAATGIAEGHSTPTQWNVETNSGIRWKTPIPGLGHSSPVVWGDRVFVTTAISGKKDPELKVGLDGSIAPVDDDSVHRYLVYCLDRKTGEIKWQKVAHEGVPKIKRHPKSTHANPTPATNGEYVVAFFGSEGLFVYEMEGRLVWKKDLGVLESSFFMVPNAQWGHASSPIIYENKVIVQCDVLKGSFLAAFNLEDGKEIWRVDRDDFPTWSTPNVIDAGGSKVLVVNGFKHIGGYDPESGKEIWRLKGGGDIPIPTPFAAHGLVFITNSHGSMAPIYAIRADAQGDISLAEGASSNESIAWSQSREGAYMPTPLVYGDHLYVCRDNGVLSVYDAKTGERHYQERLGAGAFSASTVAADGKVYFTSEDGDIFVVKAGPKFELLASNPMGEICMASPAISQGALFFRTRGHLVAVGE